MEKHWRQAKAARQIASNSLHPAPGCKKELMEAKACMWIQDRAQAAIAREASAFLKQHGYTAGGKRRVR